MPYELGRTTFSDYSWNGLYPVYVRGEAYLAAHQGSEAAAEFQNELATLTSEIESRGGRASFVVTDVAIAKDVERMVAHAIETFGRLDYAVNNAGIEGQLAGIMDLPEEEWDRVFNIPERQLSLHEV